MGSLYPLNQKLEIYITDGDTVGAVTYSAGHAKLVTDDEMPGILAQVLKALPPGYRLMDRAESTMHFMREERGYRGPNLVIPKPDNGTWFDPAADRDWTDLGHVEERDEDED